MLLATSNIWRKSQDLTAKLQNEMTDLKERNRNLVEEKRTLQNQLRKALESTQKALKLPSPKKSQRVKELVARVRELERQLEQEKLAQDNIVIQAEQIDSLNETVRKLKAENNQQQTKLKVLEAAKLENSKLKQRVRDLSSANAKLKENLVAEKAKQGDIEKGIAANAKNMDEINKLLEKSDKALTAAEERANAAEERARAAEAGKSLLTQGQKMKIEQLEQRAVAAEAKVEALEKTIQEKAKKLTSAVGGKTPKAWGEGANKTSENGRLPTADDALADNESEVIQPGVDEQRIPRRPNTPNVNRSPRVVRQAGDKLGVTVQGATPRLNRQRRQRNLLGKQASPPPGPRNGSPARKIMSPQMKEKLQEVVRRSRRARNAIKRLEAGGDNIEGIPGKKTKLFNSLRF